MVKRAAFNYIQKEALKGLGVYALAIVLVIALIIGGVFVFTVTGNDNSTIVMVGGMEFAAAIFIGIWVLASFRENFHMLIQNGASRKKIFSAYAYTILVISALLSIFSILQSTAGDIIGLFNPTVGGTGIFDLIYGNNLGFDSRFLYYIILLLLGTAVFAACAAGCLFITSIFYRMSKQQRTIAGIGFPVFFFIVLPIIDLRLFNNAITKFVGRAIDFMFGLSFGKPLSALLSFTIISIIFGILSFLVLKTTSVKIER